MTMRTVIRVSCAILVLVQTSHCAGLGLPGLQEIMARWQTYQANPTLLRIQPRKMMMSHRSSAGKAPPPSPEINVIPAVQTEQCSNVTQQKLTLIIHLKSGSQASPPPPPWWCEHCGHNHKSQKICGQGYTPQQSHQGVGVKYWRTAVAITV